MRPRRRLRVLFAIDDMGIGGAQKQVAEVVRRLADDEFETGVVCMESGGENIERLPSSTEVDVLGIRRVYDNRAAAAVARLAKKIRGRWDVVEAYLPAAHFFTALALAGSRRTALIAARRNLAFLDPAWYAAASLLLNRLTHISAANSLAVKASLARRYRLRPSRIAVIPNVVERAPDSVTPAEARRRLGVAADEFIVVAAGSITRLKNYETILRAFAAFVKGHPARLLVAGDGPERARVAAFARDMGLNGEVCWLGMLPDANAVLSAADVFVHASKSEGSSNAVLEAMAHALPVVASDIAANREAVGENAYFFECDDWRGCADGLAWFAADRVRARRTGEALARRAETRFDPAAIILRRSRLYRRIWEVLQ